MENLIHFLNWEHVLLILIFANTLLKGVRDAIDSTPDTDDNFFERGVTILGKVLGYLVGKRAQ